MGEEGAGGVGPTISRGGRRLHVDKRDAGLKGVQDNVQFAMAGGGGRGR